MRGFSLHVLEKGGPTPIMLSHQTLEYCQLSEYPLCKEAPVEKSLAKKYSENGWF